MPALSPSVAAEKKQPEKSHSHQPTMADKAGSPAPLSAEESAGGAASPEAQDFSEEDGAKPSHRHSRAMDHEEGETVEAGSGGVETGDVGGGQTQNAIPEAPVNDPVLISVCTTAWIWGLLPGLLTGGVITYFLWTVAADVAVEECTSSDCRLAAEMLRTGLNWSANPCDDFYNYVCTNFKSDEQVVLGSVTAYMHNLTEAMLYTIDVPPSGQNALQKATGLYRACISMVLNDRSEVSSLKDFLVLVGLDISNIPPSPDFNTVECIVRLSFEYGLPAIVRFSAVRLALYKKKILTMGIDSNYTEWLGINSTMKLYKDYLEEYDSDLDAALVGIIFRAENTVRDFIDKLLPRHGEDSVAVTTLGELDNSTQHSIAKGGWARLIGNYTDKTYGPSDAIIVLQNTTELMILLAGNGTLGRNDARLLLSWRLVHQLLPLASSRIMIRTHEPFQKKCFETVYGVMEMALMNTYLRYSVPQTAVHKASEMAHRVRSALTDKIESTDWIEGFVKRISLEKASYMRFVIAYPSNVANTAQMEVFFADFPDARTDSFFSTWLSAHRLLTQRLFKNSEIENITIGMANAWYQPLQNMLTIPAGIMQPPIFFGDGTAALNYGGLGQIMGHEIMHGYDVDGIVRDYKGQTWTVKRSKTLDKYAAMVLCLRESYEKAAKERNLALVDDMVDSEGFADYAGLLLAYAAYRSVSPQERYAVLPGVGMSAEQTFFVAHCLKWCDVYATVKRTLRYWNSRSRCVVPLRNMPQFANAYSCSRESSMNPPKKCDFW